MSTQPEHGGTCKVHIPPCAVDDDGLCSPAHPAPESAKPRYFVADDGGGTIALWRNRPDEPNRPDPVLYQHSADPGVWDAAVAALVRGDGDTPTAADELVKLADQLAEQIADLPADKDQIDSGYEDYVCGVADAAKVVRKRAMQLRAGAPGGDKR